MQLDMLVRRFRGTLDVPVEKSICCNDLVLVIWFSSSQKSILIEYALFIYLRVNVYVELSNLIILILRKTMSFPVEIMLGRIN